MLNIKHDHFFGTWKPFLWSPLWYMDFLRPWRIDKSSMPRGCLGDRLNEITTRRELWWYQKGCSFGFWIRAKSKMCQLTSMKVVLDPSTDMKVVLDPRIQFLKPPTRVVPLCSRRVGRWGHACLGRSQNGDVPGVAGWIPSSAGNLGQSKAKFGWKHYTVWLNYMLHQPQIWSPVEECFPTPSINSDVAMRWINVQPSNFARWPTAKKLRAGSTADPCTIKLWEARYILLYVLKNHLFTTFSGDYLALMLLQL